MTTTTTRTYTLGLVAWTRGPLDRPADTFTELTQLVDLEAAAKLAAALEPARQPVVGELERTVALGDEVRVQAFGRMRTGRVVGFGRTKVTVELVKNASGEKITRNVSACELYLTPAQEAAEVARLRAAVAAVAPAAQLPTRTDAGRMTDEALQAAVDALEARRDALDYDAGDEATEALDAQLVEAIGHLEAEQDARDAWHSDDDRVRESVGNYTPAAR